MSIYRNELKFLCTEREFVLLEGRINAVMLPDSYGGGKPYSVRSVYFDDYENSCMCENEAGISKRNKFRIRIYNGDNSFIRLEIKSKNNGYGKKESGILALETCCQYIKGIPEQITEDLPHVRRRLSLEMALRGLHPVNIVEYERKAFTYPHGNVRITFDRNISCTPKVGDFLKESVYLTPIMPKGLHVLEVKYDEFLPDFIAGLLEIGTLERTAFSKYYFARCCTYS